MNITFGSVKKIIKWVVVILFVILLAYPFVTSHSVLTPIAVATNTPTLCRMVTNLSIGNTTDYVLGCYASIATAHRDVSVCDYIGTAVDSVGKPLYASDSRSKCYALVAEALRDFSICDNANNVAKDQCYLHYSRVLEDIVVCKNIENVRQQTFCYEYFRSGDACYEIKNEAKRLQCTKQDACSTHQC